MIEAIITGVVAIIVCMINNYCQQKRTEKQQQETVSLIVYRLDQLEKKQDLHNNAVERLYEVERKLGIDEEKIRVANHRIEDLERAEKAGE
jgi:hypothetical protein